MSLPRGLWDRHIALLQGVSDVARPVVAAAVVDLSRYTTSGAGYVGVSYGGALLWAVYRDGPAPALGDLLQIKRGDAARDARWYAWPLPYAVPAGCAGQLYVSAQRTDTGAWDIIRCDLAVGNVWQHRSASPVSGDYPRRPLHSYRGTRLLTWGSSADLATPGPLYYSDDTGLSWTACGINITNLSRQKYGYLYAVGGDTLYMSVDSGATWTSWPAPGAGPLYAVATTQAALDRSITVLGPDGAYQGTFAPPTGEPYGWSGPTAPGGAGWTTVSAWFAGGATSNGTALPGGVDSPGRVFDQADDVLHAATGGAAYRHVPSASEVLYAPPTGVGSRDVYWLTHNTPDQWPVGSYGMVDPCYVVALDATASGATRYVARNELGTGDWYDFGGRQLADLGAEYVASAQGLSTLQFWEYNAGDAAPPPTFPYRIDSAPGGTRTPGIGDDTAITTTAGAGWEAVGYDDTAWSAPVAVPGPAPDGGAQKIGPGVPDAPVYVRRTFTPPSGATTCTLTLWTEGAAIVSARLNGIALIGGSGPTWTVDGSAALLPGATNVLAFVAAGPPVDYVGFGTSLGVGIAFSIAGS